ncbi:glycosyltransferase [Microbacterium limosum]|uniref:Glycosyltransferase n=1 Tax=Microbacterium limosum TaxID=3079935 RepID=A0AAU0MIH9_9MICO|nr:glycosyltransferase [Microbacterium sp. Y20]WOQ69969.1 glycosyltransferase [Microbacterium sp. Y20]
MTLLLISPDYASHLLPLATIATAWRDRGHRVVVATGPATADIVAGFGFERVHLQLGRGSNPGVIRADEQPRDEADSLRGFFAATREGMVPTLAYQAKERLTDLMWDPVAAGRATLRIVADLRPEAILIDHLAFSARLALDAAGHDYADVVLGHPSALPVRDELYGFPPAWPDAFRPTGAELSALRELCERVSRNFTREWNRATAQLDAAATPTASAFATHGPRVFYNYPAQLRPEASVDGAVFLGSTRRVEPADAEVEAWLADAVPFVYVSFGSFLSVRADVLRRVADALRALGVRAAIASGSTPVAELGEIPGGWLVRPYLPQVRLLGAAAAAVTHGGNNSVTEALGACVPLLVLPFSTDQFAGAAAIEAARVGLSLDPNVADGSAIADAVASLLDGRAVDAATLEAIAADQRAAPGPERAYRSLTSARIAEASSDAVR